MVGKYIKRAAGLLLSAALLTTALAGCNGGGKAGGDGEIVVAMSQDLTTFDPIGAGSSSLQDQMVYRQIYARLFATDEDMQPVPELAKSYEKVSDTEYKFTIYDNAVFSDGSSITAEDVAYSLERAHQSEAFATLMATVDTIEATGANEITIKTTGPSPALLQALAHPGASILPQAYVEQAMASNDWSAPVTSGRYTVKARDEGRSTTLAKNADYFNPDDAAQNEGLVFINASEDSTRTIMVQTGEADISSNFSTTDYDIVQDDDGVKLHEKAGTTVQYLGFDTTQEPFNNPLVRQAIAYAINREEIMTVAAEGLGSVSYSVIPPSTLGYLDGNPAGYSYDVERAKELMAQAGYADGFSTQIVTFSDTGQTIASVAQSYLAQININAEVKRYDTSVRMDMFASHQCPMFAAQWGALADAELVLPRLFTEGASYNWSFFQDNRVDTLLNDARQTEDSDQRAQIYGEAVKIIDEASPWVPVYIPNAYALARADLQGVTLDGEGLMNLHCLHY